MIGVYGKATEEENGWFDCNGISSAVFWPYCYVAKPAYSAAQGVKKQFALIRTVAIILGVLGLGAVTFIGINAIRKKKRTRRNPRKKQTLVNRAVRIAGGTVLTGLGAIGYAGPQAAEPISTVVGGGMSLSGLYLIGSGVIGTAEAKNIRKEIRG